MRRSKGARMMRYETSPEKFFCMCERARVKLSLLFRVVVIIIISNKFG